MPLTYIFKDSRTSDSVAKALLFVAKFSKKQAFVKFSDSSVSVIWGGSPKTYFIHAEATALDMFKNRQQLRHYGIDHCTVIQVDPSILGKTLKGGTHDRNVSVVVTRPQNTIKVKVEYVDTAKRVMTHTIPCDFKTFDDYRSMLIEEIETTLCRYNTRSYVDNIHRFKHILDSFVKLNTPRVYIWSKRSNQCNDLTIHARTQGSNICVSLTDLEDGLAHLAVADEFEEDDYLPRRADAGVNIDTKRLASFLSGLAQKKSKVSFDIEHNKCLKITLDNEISQGEKFYQSLLLLHSLNN